MEQNKLDNPAVLVIDMQEEFLDFEDKEIKKRLLDAQKGLLGICKEKDIPVIVMEYEYHTSGKTIDDVTESLKGVPRIKYHMKGLASGFSNCLLEKTLRNEYHSENIILTGVTASVCVFSTALDAIKRGFRISTSADLIADVNDDRNPEEIYLSWYRKNCSSYFDSYVQLIDLLKKK